MAIAGGAALTASLVEIGHELLRPRNAPEEEADQPRRPRNAPEEAHSDTSPPPIRYELADSSDFPHGGVPTMHLVPIMHRVPTMHNAAALGHLRYLHHHNDMDPLRFSIPDPDGNPPMYYAVKYNQYEAIRFLGRRYRDTKTLLTPRQIVAIEQLGHDYLTRSLRGKQTIEEALDSIVAQSS